MHAVADVLMEYICKFASAGMKATVERDQSRPVRKRENGIRTAQEILQALDETS